MRVSRREQKNRKKAVGAAVAEVRRLGELDNGHTRKQPNSFAFMLEWFFLCGGFVAAGSLPSASSLPDGLVPQSQELTDVARRTARFLSCRVCEERVTSLLAIFRSEIEKAYSVDEDWAEKLPEGMGSARQLCDMKDLSKLGIHWCHSRRQCLPSCLIRLSGPILERSRALLLGQRLDIDLHDDGSASLKKAGIRGRGRTKMTRAVAVAVSSGSSDHSWGTGRRHPRGVLPGLPALQEFPFACGVSFRQAEITHSLAKETLHSERFHYKSYMVQHACQKAFDDMELIADAVARAYEGARRRGASDAQLLMMLNRAGRAACSQTRACVDEGKLRKSMAGAKPHQKRPAHAEL
ncbi:hypothetical protein AK812_SmicGene22027 [Symbiodinium microadriaticum]|uniref:Uncharacterized protein n=1 Tax=Symbiodinium microadriaticum TaxID=2951 RepID=A0A1Q9DKT4_SYMMI|nr:hypothetical protein AK812_SmicGene22027 [Symbiodinium microadriaticum]